MEYPQGLNRDANRIPTTGIGQTRNGMDEFINLVALYEYDKDTNLYFPPGILPNPSAPRVDIADQTVVSAIKAAATTAATLATEATVIQERLGNADDPKTTDPDAREATALGLLRGLLDYMVNTKAVIDDVHDAENHLLKTSATGGTGNGIDYTAVLQSILTQVQTSATETTLAALKGVIDGLIENGALKTNAVVNTAFGCRLEEQKTNADAVDNVITFAENIAAIEIYHEESNWQTFVVNGLTLKVPAGGWSRPIGGTPGATVTIPAEISCIVGRLG